MRKMRGVTLLDVLLAIVIFVIGMLALAHLQTNLTRSSTDANTRTVAANVGEELLETLRAFRRVSTDPDGALFAFADIDDAYVNRTIERGGINYTVTADVKGYNFSNDKTAVTEFDPAVAGTVYDFKVVELTVAWDNNQAFQIDDAQAPIANTAMGSGNIEISSLIPSIPSLTAAKVAAEDDGALGYVPVDYTPGERPDIVAIDLDRGNQNNSRFKESTSPAPEVIRSNQLVETWFDVITYNNSQDPSLFLRREEFLVVSCQCELRKPSGNENTGFLPTIWNGISYTEGEWVSKNYGVSASNQNSAYCDVCCRDHHDMSGASDDQMYDPAREWTGAGVNGDHKHYDRSNQGALTEATQAGDEYMEACRMVRKDGFMRVAQDFRQEGFIAFPAGYLDTLDGAGEYSDYVADAITDFHENNRDALTKPDGTSDPVNPASGIAYTFPASSPDNATSLPTLAGLDSQQLRSRGIYIDHVSAAAEAIINCVIANPGACEDAPGVDHYLEVFPFFEVQTTWLSDWFENTQANPVSVTSDTLETDNTHDRGLAVRTGSAQELVTVTTEMHRGNVGLAVIDPIDPLEDSVATAEAGYELFVNANGGGNPPTPTGYTWSGTFVSGVGGVNATDAIVTPGANTTCQRAGTSINCTTTFGSDGSVVISGYYRNANTSLWICGSSLDGITIVNGDPTAAVKSATLTWPDGTNPTNVVLFIDNSACN